MNVNKESNMIHSKKIMKKNKKNTRKESKSTKRIKNLVDSLT